MLKVIALHFNPSPLLPPSCIFALLQFLILASLHQETELKLFYPTKLLALHPNHHVWSKLSVQK